MLKTAEAIPHRPIVFFDGYCNLCNRTVQFILKRDKKELFLFAPLSGSTAASLLGSSGMRQHIPDSFILYDRGQISDQSTAALSVISTLPGWKWLRWLTLFPEKFRNRVYRFIARYRYRWFGKRTACWLPTPALKQRFLD